MHPDSGPWPRARDFFSSFFLVCVSTTFACEDMDFREPFCKGLPRKSKTSSPSCRGYSGVQINEAQAEFIL